LAADLGNTMQNQSQLTELLEDLTEFLALHPNTLWLDVLLVDMNGVIRGKRYPRSEMEKVFRKGIQFPVSSYFLDVTGRCLDAEGRGYSDGDPDANCYPQPGTLAPVPWSATPGAQVLLSMPTHRGLIVDPRVHAQGQVAALQALGFDSYTAFEVEFMLLDPQSKASRQPIAAVSKLTGHAETLGQVYSMEDIEAMEPFLDAIAEASRIQAIPASVVSSEYASGQFEINLEHVSDPITAADHCILFKRLIRSVARQQGYEACFMAKPLLDDNGNGLHVHMSLTDSAGINAFSNGQGGDSELLKQAVAGLLSSLPDAMALYAPNINSFRRFKPGTFVPVGRTWGYNNRSVAVRIPDSEASARRFEFRAPGADANPYLVLSAILTGVIHGLTQQLDPGPPALGNISENVDAQMPLTWHQAIEVLARSELFTQTFGPEYLKIYCESKRLEAQSFHDYINDREYEWYML